MDGAEHLWLREASLLSSHPPTAIPYLAVDIFLRASGREYLPTYVHSRVRIRSRCSVHFICTFPARERCRGHLDVRMCRNTITTKVEFSSAQTKAGRHLVRCAKNSKKFQENYVSDFRNIKESQALRNLRKGALLKTR